MILFKWGIKNKLNMNVKVICNYCKKLQNKYDFLYDIWRRPIIRLSVRGVSDIG